MTDHPKIKPCPFCGGQATLDGHWSETPEGVRSSASEVSCDNCAARGPSIAYAGPQYANAADLEAIQKWNKAYEKVEELRHRLLDNWLDHEYKPAVLPLSVKDSGLIEDATGRWVGEVYRSSDLAAMKTALICNDKSCAPHEDWDVLTVLVQDENGKRLPSPMRCRRCGRVK